MVLGLLAGGAAVAQTAPDAKTETKTTDAKVPAAKTQDSKDAKAQSQAATDANASGDTTTVTVTGQKPVNRIDRQVYDNTKDPDSKTGTALDALAKVPGVSVDASGGITLRGKEPTILINGRPSPLLQGDNRTAALQGMSSGSITSFEVQNNPGAQYGTGSSSSVINLITSAVLPPGGNINVRASSTGGLAVFGSGHYQVDKLSLNGSLNASNDKTNGKSGSVRRSLDSNGQTLRRTESNGRNKNESNFTNASLGADYMFSRKDTLSVGYTYVKIGNTSELANNNVYYNAAGVATDIYTSTGTGDFGNENQTGSLTWSHTGAKPGETLKIDFRATQSLNTSNFSNLSLYSKASSPSALAGLRSRSESKTKSGNSTFSVDYNVPVGNDQLATGLQITTDNNNSRTQFSSGTAASTTLTPSAFGNNTFEYSQTVSAGYATYQKPIGDHWSVLGGLRVEVFELEANALSVNLTNHVSYTTYNPSLFASYIISEKAKLRFSYSHRLQRPGANDYNPATVQTSESSVSVGQSNLKPTETDSFETGYEYSSKATSYQLRGYATHETGMVIYVVTFIADPLNLGNLVQRTGRQNAGTRDTFGTEFNFNGKLTPKLSLNFNANLSNVTLDTPNFFKTKSVSGLTGSARLSYALNPKDRFLVSFNISPRTLSTQGYRLGTSSIGLQYARTINPTTNLTVVVNDIGRSSSKFQNYTDTRTANGYNVNSRPSPTFYVALSKRFGGTQTSAAGATARPVIGGPGAPAGAASPGGGGGPSGGVIIIR